MRFQFANSDLEDLYYEEKGKEAYPDYVVTAFFKRMQTIKSAKNENDLRAIKGNHFEKMEGENNKYSIRLNQQYRLIFSLENDGTCKIMLIKEISNHYL
jgi:plasmid maintenance system killer protein